MKNSAEEPKQKIRLRSQNPAEEPKKNSAEEPKNPAEEPFFCTGWLENPAEEPKKIRLRSQIWRFWRSRLYVVKLLDLPFIFVNFTFASVLNHCWHLALKTLTVHLKTECILNFDTNHTFLRSIHYFIWFQSKHKQTQRLIRFFEKFKWCQEEF